MMPGWENVEGSLSRVDVIKVLWSPIHGQTFYTLILAGENIFAPSTISLYLMLNDTNENIIL